METLLSIGSFVAYLSPVTVLLVSVLILVVLIGALLGVQLRNNAHLHHLTYPVYDYTVKEAEKKANQILTEAQDRAREVLAAAEMEAAKAVGERSKESEQLTAQYEKRLAELMHKHETALESYVGNAEQAFGSLAQTLKEHVASSQHEIERQLQAFATDTQATRKALEEETKRLIAEHLDKEFAAVKSGLETYRQERMKRVERDIVSIVEQAVAITLRKELPLKDHADLVFEALEEAKREGTFV